MTDEPQTTSLAPGFLVSVPQLQDPNFDHAVVFLIAHGEEGAFGLTVNRRADVDLEDVLDELELPAADHANGEVLLGGPVEPGRGFLLHGGDTPLPGAETVGDGIHLSGEPETLRLAVAGATPFRLCLGYAGWGPGQLEAEFTQGAWLTAPAAPRYLFELPVNQVWERVLRDIGIDPATIRLSDDGPAN
ncbi:MAG: YqgE/AlgH family protein [Candidatus Dadabacteria bacterium]|nr:MAG: YqgE/AlgH family protein [Candidatus Dadabacteria bacterium]